MVTNSELDSFWADFLLVGCAYPYAEQQRRLDRLLDHLRELKKLREIDGWSEAMWAQVTNPTD